MQGATRPSWLGNPAIEADNLLPPLSTSTGSAYEAAAFDHFDERQEALKFADCELWIEKRELLVGGVVQRVQPRVFELVQYLIEHRDRVVTREELLRHVWKTSHVSDSVIGRCVMKARRVLRDSDTDNPIIRTLPRTGYRFAGTVVAASRIVRQSSDAPQAAQGHQVVVATMPFINRTGNDDLIWVEFGLAALLNRVLKASAALSVAPLIHVVGALNRAGLDCASEGVPDDVRHILDAHAVIRVKVGADQRGFSLTCNLCGDSPSAGLAVLYGPNLVEMTTELGRTIIHKLSFGSTSLPTDLPTPDTFTREAFARAKRASHEQRFQVALDYLEVCVVSDSHPFEMDVEYVVNLAAVDHPETDLKARRILARAAKIENAALQMRILRSLSAYHRAQGNQALARNLINTAIDLTKIRNEDALTAEVLLERSEQAIIDRDFGISLHLCKRALAIAHEGEDDRFVAQCLRQQGVVAHLRGEVELAMGMLRRSETLSRGPHVQNATLASTLHRMAIVHRDAGRLREAINAIDEAEALARAAGTPARHALVLNFQSTLHGCAGNRDAAEIAHQKLDALSYHSCRTSRFLSSVSAASLSWRAGRIDDALSHMAPVRSGANNSRNLWLSFAIGLHTSMAITGAQFALARELIAEMEANQNFYEGTCLQGTSEFFRAALDHRQGDRSEAWRRLKEILRHSSAGVVRSNACLAAAWLGCEDRTLKEIQGWLDEVPGWTAEHPHGIVALARYRFEAGDWAAAVAHQSRYVEHWPSDEVNLHSRSLLALYREAARTGTATAIPRLPYLLTLKF